MSTTKLKATGEKLLGLADIKIDGPNPWDLKVNNEKFYKRVVGQGSLGLGESYMDGWWESPSLDQLFDRLLTAKLDEKVRDNWAMLLQFIVAKVFNLQTKNRAFKIGEHHYDIGNDLYQSMLDKRMVYTCGYWKNASNLDEAQENKLDLICKKLNLKAGQKVLDVGCGWGSFLKYAAEKYGAEGVGITVSKEQIALAKQTCAGLPIEIRLQDYRDLNEQFDHIVSLGMIEHVGQKNYRNYMKIMNRSLKDNGLFLLQTIGGNSSVKSVDPWIGKYIFPNSMLPSIKQIGQSIENVFVMEDLHNFSAYYDKTLMAWFANFDKNWPQIKDKYGDRFYRMWQYYLLCCAGTFRSRMNQLWQIVLSKKGVPGGYESIR